MEFVEVDGVVEDAAAAGAAALVSRERSLRLNRNCGVISETKFSAAVAPLRRIVASTTPVFTVAVRIAPRAGAEGWFDADRLCQYSAPAIIVIARIEPIQRLPLLGRRGRTGTTSGWGDGGGIAGAGTLIVLRYDVHYRAKVGSDVTQEPARGRPRTKGLHYAISRSWSRGIRRCCGSCRACPEEARWIPPGTVG